jgi:hypothetical protein
MKIATNNSTVQTNSTSIESHDFSIGDVSTIIDILRNRLYSNPIQTLTQEYLSNARDSHRESNQKRPITVTLPTRLDSVLKIRDYGVGLDKQRVRDVFVNYGISTKRSDNTQTGGFGLGAKSAWAYTDSFVVVSYYNSVRYTYVAHTGKNKNGTFELIDESATEEPNGVEVQIPIKETDIQRFVTAVYRTTFFWEVKPELKGITGVEIPKEYSDNNFDFKSNNTMLVKESQFVNSIFNTAYQTNKIFALIDGIPYDLNKVSQSIPAARTISQIVNNNYITFIAVNNGDISVAASREEISADQDNVDTITKLYKSTVNNITEIVLEEFNRSFGSLKNYVEVYERMSGVVNYFYLTLDQSQKDLIFRYTQDGFVFNFDLAHNYSCSKIENVCVHRLKKKRVREYVTHEMGNSIGIGEKSVVVIKDEEFSDTVKNRKLRSVLDQGKTHVHEIICKDSDDIPALQKICEAKLLSELYYERGVYNPKTGRVKSNDEVQIRRLEKNYGGVVSRGIETIKLLDIEAQNHTYVVVPFSKEARFDSENEKFVEMVDFIGTRNGYTVIKCGKRDYNKLIELDNVEEYDDVVDNVEEFFPIAEENIRKSIFAKVNTVLHSLRRHRDKIDCDHFEKLFDSYPDKVSNYNLQTAESILTKHYPRYAEIAKEFKAVESLEQKIFKLYPLLSMHNTWRNEMLVEYIYYINNKSQFIKSKE